MATILSAWSWDCGDVMVAPADQYVSGSQMYIAVTTTHKHTGAYALRYQQDSGSSRSAYTQYTLTGTPSNPSVSVWLYHPQTYADDARVRLRFLLDTGEYIELRWDGTDKTFDAYVGGVKVADGTIVVPSNDWFHVQFYVVVDDSPTGEINVKINGHESVAYTGDTKPQAGTTGATYFQIYYTGSYGEFVYIDDLVVGYGGYLGDLRCVDIRPNADTAQDDWTPSAGDNYSTIDEAPPSDSDYNESSVDGDADELDMTDFDGATYIPVAITAWVRARQDAGVGDSIYVGVDSEGTDDVSPAQPLSNTFIYYFHTLDDNPHDSAEWEDADIDALKLRYVSDIP